MFSLLISNSYPKVFQFLDEFKNFSSKYKFFLFYEKDILHHCVVSFNKHTWQEWKQ